MKDENSKILLLGLSRPRVAIRSAQHRFFADDGVFELPFLALRSGSNLATPGGREIAALVRKLLELYRTSHSRRRDTRIP